MKAILISIQPKWCELIANGKKTIEVRKSRPKLDTPFKCYIYCTASDVHSGLIVGGGTASLIRCCNYKTGIPIGGEIGNGQVIGEFVCDRVDEYTFSNLEADYRVNHIELSTMCLNYPDLIEYGKGNILYGWHISDLVIYDKPKELCEFYIADFKGKCEFQKTYFSSPFCTASGEKYFCKELNCDKKKITRPFQSWGYVEALSE